MASDPHREILSDLTRANVEFIVGGGVACMLHGVERVTMDVDLAVLMAPSNLRAFLAVMESLGLRPRVLTRTKLLSIKLGIVPARAKDAVDIEFLRGLVP